ncbi:MAG: BatD family protein [Balneolales bacterium]
MKQVKTIRFVQLISRWLAMVPAAMMLIIPGFAEVAFSNDIQLSASVSSGNVIVGQTITLNVEIRSSEPLNVSRPELPELDGMQYLSTIPQTATSYSLVNGVAQMTYRYSYSIEASDTGAYLIPSVYVDIDGEEYQTQPITVVINPDKEADQQRATTSTEERPSIYLELELSEERPVRGQQIIAEIVLYFHNTVDVNSFHVSRSWQTEGFWREDLSQSQTRRPDAVILGGAPYRRVVLSRYALFPTRSGELMIPSYGIQATVRDSRRDHDRFSTLFDGFRRQRVVNLESPPRTLRVLTPPLPPSDGQLISAFGQFTIERSLSDEQVKLGEAVDVITEISGTGNLGLITQPVYDYPGSFDSHRLREVLDRDETAPGMTGSKQFRDVLIAGRAGRFNIPENTILIYNDATRQYEEHVLPELNLEVVRDPNARVTMAENDAFRLTPMRGTVVWTQSSRTPFYLLWWFWFALVIPLALLLAGFRSIRYQQKLITDEYFSRYELAHHHAMSILEEIDPLDDAKTVYSSIYKVISNFITDRLNLPSAGFTEAELVQELRKRNVEDPLVHRIYRMLEKSATIRYAPDPAPDNKSEDLEETRKLINELKLQL